MPYITANQASKILGISKRTLFRWEGEGKVRNVRDGIMKVRVYDKDYVEMVKNILDLNQKEKDHLAKLPNVLYEAKKHHLEQDYIPGKPLKLLTDVEVDAAMKAFDNEEEWMKEHKRILHQLFSYPMDIIREVLNPK